MGKILIADEVTGEVTEKPKYRNQDNYKFGDFDKDQEQGGGESLTVPDMSYSIKEILEKYTRNLIPDIQKEGEFAENPDFDDVDETRTPGFDLADASEILNDFESRRSVKKVSSEGGSSVADDNETKKPDEKPTA